LYVFVHPIFFLIRWVSALAALPPLAISLYIWKKSSYSSYLFTDVFTDTATSEQFEILAKAAPVLIVRL
jgi:hypothetical protein